jgi:hypothetical protein
MFSGAGVEENMFVGMGSILDANIFFIFFWLARVLDHIVAITCSDKGIRSCTRYIYFAAAISITYSVLMNYAESQCSCPNVVHALMSFMLSLSIACQEATQPFP